MTSAICAAATQRDEVAIKPSRTAWTPPTSLHQGRYQNRRWSGRESAVQRASEIGVATRELATIVVGYPVFAIASIFITVTTLM
jgi:hypothetical protein